ncbi:unnamed protein product [Macrosiphum euphorbiae]|uniref:PARP catalytic domain-containing protein n=1 Tax=Macrosiphum euphorbiae TaxID=13131 RepID=A0AAV0XPY3_9HEMI|nr:unnamed protein product [Macrosiphum euphorbiae]
MYGMYLLHKEEIRLANGGNDVKEKVLYHVTSESNAVESLISGLDWRRTQRSRFGSGVSFSNDADYCNYYANNSTDKVGARVIIINTVLMNDTYLTKRLNKENTLCIPPGTADTTVSPNGHVFVKYYDFESYPLFFVYYRWTPELLNESKFFIIKTEQMLCEQVADLHIAESSTLQRRSRSASKQRRRRQRRAAAKADAEAAARADAESEARADAEAEANAELEDEAAEAKAEADAEAKEQTEAEAAALLQCHRQYDIKQRRQRLRRAASKAEADAEAKEQTEAEAAALLQCHRQYDIKQRRQRLRRAAFKAEAESEAAEAADLLRRQRRYDSKQRRQRLSRAAAKAEVTM